MYRLGPIRTIHEGFSRFSMATIVDGEGTSRQREVEDHGDAAAVLPYDPARRVALLVRQQRTPLMVRGEEAWLLEAPAGLLDDDAPEDCARREAMEEVGVRLGTLTPLGRFHAMAGISTEALHLFLAPYAAADRVARGGGLAAEGEAIEVVELPLAELAAMRAAGTLIDLKTALMIAALQLARPALFEG